MSFVTCDNCDNFASKALSEAAGWNACGPCVTGEADTIDEYTDYFEKGSANLRPHGTTSPARAARNARRRKNRSQRRAEAGAQAKQRLVQCGVKFTEHNNGNHLVIQGTARVIDFWPNSEKFHIRDSDGYGQGVEALLLVLRVGQQKQPSH